MAKPGHFRLFAPRLFPGPLVKDARARSITPLPALAAEERRVGDLVNAACGLTHMGVADVTQGTAADAGRAPRRVRRSP